MFDWWERGQDFERDMWQGRLSLRKIWDIIRHLPPGSALHRQIDPDQWRTEHQILADLYDLTLALGTAKDADRQWYPTPARSAAEQKKQDKRMTVIRESRDRFQKQLAAGGDFDG